MRASSFNAVCVGLAGGFVLACAPAQASDAMRPGGYEVTTETGTPHVDKNLSYALRRERRCVGPDDVSSLFWMLEDDSLRDCRLEKVGATVGGATYDLICTGGHGRSGAARWQFAEDRLRGELNVTLRGKNTTLYQRVTAMRLGECGDRSE
jgi:hypothetical protein